MPADALTDYGFNWGPVTVERTTKVEPRPGKGEYHVLTVKTPFRRVEIVVSPTGRSVTVREAKT